MVVRLSRRGTTTPWSCHRDELRHHTNDADATMRKVGLPGAVTYERWHDGHAIHALVGSFQPNALTIRSVNLGLRAAQAIRS